MGLSDYFALESTVTAPRNIPELSTFMNIRSESIDNLVNLINLTMNLTTYVDSFYRLMAKLRPS